jgi:hypothetical protein
MTSLFIEQEVVTRRATEDQQRADFFDFIGMFLVFLVIIFP